MRKSPFFLLIVPLLAFTIVGCDSGGGGDEARVRLIQASHANAVLSLFVDDEFLSSAPYGEASSYEDASEAVHTLTGDVGADTAFSVQANLLADVDYSIVTVTQNGGTTPVILVDDNSTPAVGNFRLRAVNASTRQASVDVYVLRENEVVTNHEPNFTSLAFTQASNYDQIDRNEWVIWVTSPGTKTVLGSSASNEYRNLENWTVVVLDDAASSGLAVSIIKDQDGDDLNF